MYELEWINNRGFLIQIDGHLKCKGLNVSCVGVNILQLE